MIQLGDGVGGVGGWECGEYRRRNLIQCMLEVFEDDSVVWGIFERIWRS